MCWDLSQVKLFSSMSIAAPDASPEHSAPFPPSYSREQGELEGSLSRWYCAKGRENEAP